MNGRLFARRIRDALPKAITTTPLIYSLKTRVLQAFKLDYHGGEKYPHLVRDEPKPDMLSEIIKPK